MNRYIPVILYLSCLILTAGQTASRERYSELFSGLIDKLGAAGALPGGTDELEFQKEAGRIFGCEPDIGAPGKLTCSSIKGAENALLLDVDKIGPGISAELETAGKKLEQGISFLVVDLRGANGDSPEGEDALVAWVSGMKLPAAVLIDEKTVNAAESAAAKLKAAGVLVAGKATCGRPGARRRVKLDSGLVLFVPNLAVDPLQPDVELKGSEAEAPRLAADLLTVLRLYRKP